MSNRFDSYTITPSFSTDPMPDSYSDILTEDDTQNPKYSDEGYLSFCGAFMQIGNTILGAGIITLPVVMRYLGFILGSIFILLIAILTIYSSYLLLKAHQITNKKKYSTIAHKALGDTGYIITNIIIILNNFGLCCVYFRIFGDTMQNIVGGFVEKDSIFVTNWHNYLYIIMIIVLMSFVICVEDFNKFEKTSFLGILGIFVYFLVIIILFFYKILFKDFSPYFNNDSYYLSGNVTDLLMSLPSVFLSFSFQYNLFPIYSGLANRTHTEMLNVTKCTIFFCFFLYVFSGIVGFLMYGTSLDDTILKAFLLDLQSENIDSFMRIILIAGNIGFLTCSTTSIPLVFYTLKQNSLSTYKYCKKKYSERNIPKIEKKLEMSEIDSANSDNSSRISETSMENVPIEVSRCCEIFLFIILYLIIGAVTILVPNLKTLFNIVGATAANAIQFIIPSYIILKLKDKAKDLVSLFFANLLFIFGIVSMIVSVFAEVIHAISSQNKKN